MSKKLEPWLNHYGEWTLSSKNLRGYTTPAECIKAYLIEERKKKTPPTLKELKSRECTKTELQAALIQLIELHNGLDARITSLLDSGRIRSSNETLMNTPYGL